MIQRREEMSASTMTMFGLRIARGTPMGMRNHDEAAGAENNE
jgi:hypothetical protein